MCYVQLIGVGVSVLSGVDPNPENFVSAGILNTKNVLIGCLLRLEPNIDKKVTLLETLSTSHHIIYLTYLQ